MVPDSKNLFWVKSGQRSTKSKRLRKYSKDKPPIFSHLRPLPSHCISIETSSYGKFFLTGEALFDGRGPNSGLCWFPCAMMLLATLWRLPANTHSTLCRHSCKTPVKAGPSVLLSQSRPTSGSLAMTWQQQDSMGYQFSLCCPIFE